MTATKHLVVALLAGALGLLCLGRGERLCDPWRDLLEFSHSTSAPMPDQAKKRYDWITIDRSQSAR